MKRRLSNLALSALTVAAVSGLTVLRTGLAADAAWRQDYTPLTVNTYPVSESFTGISVTDYYADIQLRVSRDGTVSVVTRDAEDVAHTVRVEGGTLTISRPEPTVGQRLFHHEDDDPEVTVYLPAGNYGALTVSTTSGDSATLCPPEQAVANIIPSGRSRMLITFIFIGPVLNFTPRRYRHRSVLRDVSLPNPGNRPPNSPVSPPEFSVSHPEFSVSHPDPISQVSS